MKTWLKKITRVKSHNPFMELFIVVIGVSIAFTLNNLNEARTMKREKQKVMKALKMQLDGIRVNLNGAHHYMERRIAEWDSLKENGQVNDFAHWYYIQPQHNHEIIEYAIDNRNPDLIDFQIYNQLLTLNRMMKMLADAEVQLTNLYHDYRPIPKEMEQETETYKLMYDHHRFLFQKFITFSRSRSNSMKAAVQLAEELLPQVNAQFSKKEQNEIEREMMTMILSKSGSDTLQWREKIRFYYPDKDPDDVQEIIDGVIGEK